MIFEYLFGNQATQYNFVKLPEIMLEDTAFSPLSIGAKVLYGVLLNRTGLSVQNGWLDEENRAYIIFQISEIQMKLGVSEKSAVAYLSELENFGLVEKKRRGLGLPNILYVKNFIYQGGTQNCKNYTSGTVESTVQNSKNYSPEQQKLQSRTVDSTVPYNIYNNIHNATRRFTRKELQEKINNTPLTPLGENRQTKNQEHNFDKHTNVENLEYILEQGLSDKADAILGDEMLKDLITNWMAYKDERKPKTSNHFAKRGMCGLLTKFVKNYNEYGYEKVKQVVEDSIASNYQGITWDRLEKKSNSNSYMQTMRDRVSVVDSWV